MQPRLLAAFLALRAVAAPHAVAAPQPTGGKPTADLDGIVVEDGVELDSNFIVGPIFEILSNYTMIPNISEPAVAARQAPPTDPTTVTAEVAAKMKAPGGGEKGVFYRGDSRPPSVIFAEGFAPQGGDKSLRNHLSFAGNSGLVSLSRSPETAESYAFGRSGEKTTKGYIYVIAPTDVPDGYWVPGIYAPEKNPAVARNQEFAVAGSVPATSISHAYEVTSDKPSSRGTKIKNTDYVLKKSPPCSRLGLGKRAICDPAKYTPKAATEPRCLENSVPAPVLAEPSPYAHDVLDLVKSWDNPIGHAVSWFDDSMANLQEAIGGPQVPEIYGNTLKLRFICWMRGKQQWKNDVDYACDRLRASQNPSPPKPAPSPEDKRLKSINDVLNVCDEVDDPKVSLPNDGMKYELRDRCEVFREKVVEADEKEGMPASTIVEVEETPETSAEPPRQCFDMTGPIPCGGGQTQVQLDIGRAVCGSCGSFWDPEGGKCRDIKGALIWPSLTPITKRGPTPSEQCYDSTGSLPCGGGQTEAELDIGWAVCRVCRGFAWDPEGGKCRQKDGKLLWPHKS